MGKHLYKQGLRKCYVCKEIKSLDEFHKSSKESGGLSYCCKECSLKKFREDAKKTRKTVIDFLGKECAKCGMKHENYSFFDIDHIVAIKQGRGRRRYKLSEAAEYMVLCPNCHRLKTLAENGFI